jgi:hypothetical protein
VRQFASVTDADTTSNSDAWRASIAYVGWLCCARSACHHEVIYYHLPRPLNEDSVTQHEGTSKASKCYIFWYCTRSAHKTPPPDQDHEGKSLQCPAACEHNRKLKHRVMFTTTHMAMCLRFHTMLLCQASVQCHVDWHCTASATLSSPAPLATDGSHHGAAGSGRINCTTPQTAAAACCRQHV